VDKQLKGIRIFCKTDNQTRVFFDRPYDMKLTDQENLTNAVAWLQGEHGKGSVIQGRVMGAKNEVPLVCLVRLAGVTVLTLTDGSVLLSSGMAEVAAGAKEETGE